MPPFKQKCGGDKNEDLEYKSKITHISRFQLFLKEHRRTGKRGKNYKSNRVK